MIKSLKPETAQRLLTDWEFWARPDQQEPPPPWRYWVVKAGRGFGKTRIGAEWTRKHARNYSLCNLIGATADDARDIMIDGESGILAICPKDQRPRYLKQDRKLIWPNGAVSLIFTADEPERLRGKQHRKLWPDEFCSWRYPEEAWTHAILGLRLPPDPQGLITTTPKPTKQFKAILAHPRTVVTNGTTYANRANLADAFYEDIISIYEGTRIGRQELNAELLTDSPAALWKRSWLEEGRVVKAPPLKRVVVGVDPQVGEGENAAETGIVVCGIGGDGHGYVLADATVQGSPAEWASAAVVAYHMHKADRIVAEENQGGKMVAHTIRMTDPKVAYKGVHASRGKIARAEPVAALFEQGKCHMVGAFPLLEDQLCEYEASTNQPSPDRYDALVWSITELMLEGKDRRGFSW